MGWIQRVWAMLVTVGMLWLLSLPQSSPRTMRGWTLRRLAQWREMEGGRRMFVSFNQLTVPQAEQQGMLEVFRQHTESMKQVPGCLSFELWMDGDTLVSVSHWDSKSSRDNYLKSEVYRQHHPAHGGSGQHGHGSGRVHADAHAQRPRRPSKISQFTVEKLL